MLVPHSLLSIHTHRVCQHQHTPPPRSPSTVNSTLISSTESCKMNGATQNILSLVLDSLRVRRLLGSGCSSSGRVSSGDSSSTPLPMCSVYSASSSFNNAVRSQGHTSPPPPHRAGDTQGTSMAHIQLTHQHWDYEST